MYPSKLYHEVGGQARPMLVLAQPVQWLGIAVALRPSLFCTLPSVKKLSGWSLIRFTVRTFKVWMDLASPSLKTKRFDPSFGVSSMISTFYLTEFAVMLTICSHFILSCSYFQEGETHCGFNSCNSGFSFYGFFFFPFLTKLQFLYFYI